MNPDKLPDEELESAIQTFSLLNDAYKALSDNATRAVYDKHGRRGLEALKRGLHSDMEGSGGSIDDDDDLNTSNKLIAKLGSASFPSSSSKYLWLVMFCRDGSDLAVASKLGLEALAKKMKGAYKIGAVVCGKDDEEAAFCRDRGVALDELPSFAVVVEGVVHRCNESIQLPFAKSLHEFVMNSVPKALIQNVNHPRHLHDRVLDRVATSRSKVAAVLLLTDKLVTNAFLYGLAYKYRSKLVFGESRAKNPDMAEHLGVITYPHIIAFVPTGGIGYEWYLVKFEMLRYSGEPTIDAISAWLDQILKVLS